MNTGPAVIVKKSGFFAAVAKGLFGTIITVVICATALGLYGMRMCDRNVDFIRDVMTTTMPQVLESIPDIIAAMPPIIADALNDRRAPEYRPNIDIATRLGERDGRPVAVLEIANTGEQTVSLMTLHVVFEDDDGVPVGSEAVLAATPIGCDADAPGLLMPGARRKLACEVWASRGGVNVSADITDLRVWNGPAQAPGAPDELEEGGVAGEDVAEPMTDEELEREAA